MDILAHGLWAAAAAKAYNLKTSSQKTEKLNAMLAAFWGIFPDLFAFTIPYTWLIVGPLFGDHVPRLGPPEASEPPPTDSHWVFHLASTLYNYSHSLIVFLLVFVVVLLVRHPVTLSLMKRAVNRGGNHPDPAMAGEGSGKQSERSNATLDSSLHSVPLRMTAKKIPLELLGWPLHILIDTPTHSYDFYPTPFLWPLSDLKIDGISWGTPWFFIATYAGLAIAYISLWLLTRKRKAAAMTL